MPWFSKVKERFKNFFYLPPSELPPGREDELIDRIAGHIVKHGLETPAIIFLQSLKPVIDLGAVLFMIPAAPVVELFGIPGHEYALLFTKKENVERLLRRIEQKIGAD